MRYETIERFLKMNTPTDKTFSQDQGNNSLQRTSSMQSSVQKIFIQHILIIIRQYLIEVPFQGSLVDGMEQFKTKMATKSWRNFLSAQKSESWERIRKETFLWELNEEFSKRYLADIGFRSQLQKKMVDPYHQLCLLFLVENPFPNSQLEWKKIGEVVSNVHHIHFHETQITTIPPIKHVYRVEFFHCRDLLDISKLSDVQCLTLSYTSRVQWCGPLPGLKRFSLRDIPSTADIQRLFLSSTSSLECLSTDLSYFNHFNLNDFLNLETLIISLPLLGWGNSDQVLTVVSPLRLPKLRRFISSGVSFDLVSGLKNLSYLSMKNYRQVIHDREGIFRDLQELQLSDHYRNRILCAQESLLLTSFQVSNVSADELDRLLGTKQYNNLIHLDIHESSDPLLSNSFPIGAKMRNVDLSGCQVIQFLTGIQLQKKHYHRFNLSETKISDVSNLRNITQLILVGCHFIEDINPLKNVPFLDISSCDRIRDFSCLGKQKYVRIAGSRQLKDADLLNFGDVQHLDIRSLSGVTDVSPLRNNLYRYLDGCRGIETMNFHGKDYIHISANDLKSAVVVNVYGHVYELSVKGRSKSKVNGSENIEYLLC
jgi:hypothetical protein